MGIVWIRDPGSGLLGRNGGSDDGSCTVQWTCSCNKTTLRCQPLRPAPGTCGVHRPAGNEGGN